jgi:hypothetical protein
LNPLSTAVDDSDDTVSGWTRASASISNHAICVGGQLFKPAAYAKSKRQWRRSVLRFGDRRFTAFHMVDLFAGGKEFRS